MGKLFIVPTPVGNLEDMTFRAVRVLKEVTLILAEDTRVTAKLLHHYGIETRMISNHTHNEHRNLGALIEKIRGGDVALVSDAGTPGISDPGFLLVRECIREGLEVECLPGATAFVPALVASGFPCDRFCFEGFLPQKKGRQKKLQTLSNEERTIVFYESPFRIVKALEEFVQYFGPDRLVSASREISKLHEETVRGTVASVLEHFKKHTPKGEFVLILGGVGLQQDAEIEEEED
jgi:16S rRNA (cytidine1402-2'-O)-methyltransferase